MYISSSIVTSGTFVLKKMKRWIHPYPFISTGTVSREISDETGLLQGFEILDRLEDGILLERIDDLLVDR